MISKSGIKPRKEREQVLDAIYNERKNTVLSLSFDTTEELEKKFREIRYEIIQRERIVELVTNFGNLNIIRAFRKVGKKGLLWEVTSTDR